MKKILSLLLVSSSIFSMQEIVIKQTSVFVPQKLGSVDVCYNKKGFSLIKDGKKHEVKKYFTDKKLHGITKEQLNAFLENGYLSVNQMNDGEYSIQAKGRINGGGPILASIAYWATKATCYGAIALIAKEAPAEVAIGATVGGVPTVVAGVETASTAIGALFAMIPGL
jgi:hypothetical protein